MPGTTEQPLLPAGPWNTPWSPPAPVEMPAVIQLRKRPPRQRGPKKKPRGMPFEPGNPGPPKRIWGSRPLPQGTREAFTVLSDVAFAALQNILQDDTHPRHEQAIEYVLNQAHGTARQSVDINDPSNQLGRQTSLTVTFVQQNGGGVVVQRVGTSGPTPEVLPSKGDPGMAPAIEATASPVVNRVLPAVLPLGPWNAQDEEEG